MADHNLPLTTSTYANFVTELNARFDDLALALDTTSTNLPTNSVRWTSASNKWQKWNGTAWADLATTYAISISGNAGTATTLATARTINGVSFNGSANITVTANTTNAVTFNNGGAGVASGTTFDGSVARTISYNTLGAAPLASPTFTGTPAAPTAADGVNTTQLATTAFVQSAIGGYLAKATTGGTVTLTDAEASNPVIAVTGALTAASIIVVPTTTKRLWAIYNATTGAFTLTVKTAAGTGVTVAQGKRNLVYTDGTNVYDAFNDFESIALTGTPTAPTAASGTNTTQVATTAFVNTEIAADVGTLRPFEATATNIKMNGTQAVGSLATVARGDHVHPTDTSRAPVASPTFTGVPAAPTAAAGTNTTQLATCAFVGAEIAADVGVANSALVKTAVNASGSAPIYACRAWVNFNGTGTVAIRASGNVTSITDNGVGDYTINFTTAMADTNYSFVGGTRHENDTTASYVSSVHPFLSDAKTTSALRVRTLHSSMAVIDIPEVNVAIFR